MITAIQTTYRGYKFRSRTEARWAVFFEALGYCWEYEAEGYVLEDGTHYLPDFFIQTPQGEDFYIEVKGSNVTQDPKWASFIQDIEKFSTIDLRSRLVSGTPYSYFLDKDDHYKMFICPRCGAFFDSYEISGNRSQVWYIHCQACDQETPCGGDHPLQDDGFISYRPHKGSIQFDINNWQRKIDAALNKSRAARFEHGESP